MPFTITKLALALGALISSTLAIDQLVPDNTEIPAINEVGLNLYSDAQCLKQFAAVSAVEGACNDHSPGWNSAKLNAREGSNGADYVLNFYGHSHCITGAGTHSFCVSNTGCLDMGFIANSYSYEEDGFCT